MKTQPLNVTWSVVSCTFSANITLNAIYKAFHLKYYMDFLKKTFHFMIHTPGYFNVIFLIYEHDFELYHFGTATFFNKNTPKIIHYFTPTIT